MVAARSSSECAASDRIASEPVARPTTPLASVSPPDATIEVSATRCLMSCFCCIGCPLASRRDGAVAPVAPGVNASAYRSALFAAIFWAMRTANEWQSIARRCRAPFLRRADDGLDRPALPVLPSPADAARADLHRDDHHRRGRSTATARGCSATTRRSIRSRSSSAAASRARWPTARASAPTSAMTRSISMSAARPTACRRAASAPA